jgi:hypothetical protein
MVNVSEYFTCSMALIVIHPTGRLWSAARYHAQRNSEAACRWVFLEWHSHLINMAAMAIAQINSKKKSTIPKDPIKDCA